MSTKSVGWRHCLDVLQHTDNTTFEHRLADQLAAVNDDQALTLLVDIITEDPPGSHETVVAGHMLHHLVEVSA